MTRSTIAIVVAMGATLASLAACTPPSSSQDGAAGSGATPSASASASPQQPTELGALPRPLPADGVVATGLVLDGSAPDGGVGLCLGAVLESAPPQCDGIPVADWTWDAADLSEEAGGVRWGSYAIRGTWDGTAFAVVGEVVPLALYDPMQVTPVEPQPGSTPEAELLEIQGVLQEALGADLVDSGVVDGRLDATVVFDDGTLQEHLDAIYGPNVVRLTSALLPVTLP